MTTYEKGKLYTINLSDLHADPNQPRKFIDPTALDELTASITKHGVLEPILFCQDTDGTLYVVAGERRVEAARKAGLTAIPAIFVEGNHAEIALVENLLRQDLTAVEEAEGLQALMTEQSYTQEQLGGIIGKAQNTLSEILSLNKLPREVRDDCRGDRTISRSALIVIAKKKQSRGMQTAYNAYKEKLAKQQTGKQQKAKTVPVQALMESLNKATEKLKNLDVTDWTDDDKTALAEAMTHLKTAISAALKSVAKKPKTVTNI